MTRDLGETTDVIRTPVEVIQQGEWPDQPLHGTWRAARILDWLADEGYVLVREEPAASPVTEADHG